MILPCSGRTEKLSGLDNKLKILSVELAKKFNYCGI